MTCRQTLPYETRRLTTYWGGWHRKSSWGSEEPGQLEHGCAPCPMREIPTHMQRHTIDVPEQFLEFSSFDLLKFDEGIEFVVAWLIKNSRRKTNLVPLLVLIIKWGQYLFNISFSLHGLNILTHGKVTDPGILLNFCRTLLKTMTKGPP